MSLLQTIVDLTSDSTKSLETALLKAKVLAGRLRNSELAEWAKHEIEGYPQDARCPLYRSVPVRLRAHFAGYDYGNFRQQALDVPLSVLPKKIQDGFRRRDVRQSIGSLETLVQVDDDKGSPRMPIPAEVRGLLHNKVMMNAEVTDAWLDVGAGSLQGVVAAVRSRLLEFALALEHEVGGASLDGSLGEVLVPPKVVNHTFHTHIQGAANVAVGGSDFTQLAQVREGDWRALTDLLDRLGVQTEDRERLKAAVEGDAACDEQKMAMGPRVAKWLANLGSKVSTTTVGEITKALLSTMGIGA